MSNQDMVDNIGSAFVQIGQDFKTLFNTDQSLQTQINGIDLSGFVNVKTAQNFSQQQQMQARINIGAAPIPTLNYYTYQRFYFFQYPDQYTVPNIGVSIPTHAAHITSGNKHVLDYTRYEVVPYVNLSLNGTTKSAYVGQTVKFDTILNLTTGSDIGSQKLTCSLTTNSPAYVNNVSGLFPSNPTNWVLTQNSNATFTLTSSVTDKTVLLSGTANTPGVYTILANYTDPRVANYIDTNTGFASTTTTSGKVSNANYVLETLPASRPVTNFSVQIFVTNSDARASEVSAIVNSATKTTNGNTTVSATGNANMAALQIKNATVTVNGTTVDSKISLVSFLGIQTNSPAGMALITVNGNVGVATTPVTLRTSKAATAVTIGIQYNQTYEKEYNTAMALLNSSLATVLIATATDPANTTYDLSMVDTAGSTTTKKGI